MWCFSQIGFCYAFSDVGQFVKAGDEAIPCLAKECRGIKWKNKSQYSMHAFAQIAITGRPR